MKRWWLRGFGLLLLVLVVVAAAAPREDKPKGIFAPLEKGQKVSLKETAHGYQIDLIPGVELGYTVLEVGPDYVVVEDIAKVSEIHVPVYAVRSITITRLPK